MEEILGTTYIGVSEDFRRGICPIARTIKAEKHDLAVITAVRETDMEKEKRLGNIYGFDGGNYAGNVYDKDGLSPTIRTYQGGNQQPMVVAETKCLNSKGGRGGVDGLQPSVQDRVYDTDGISTAITSSYMPSIIEKQIVAMRGRNPDNPPDRTAGSPTEQRLEPNSQGICNTLTSVQKDNLLLENVCINDRGFANKEPQVSIGIAPTLRAETHGNLPKVIEMQYRIRRLIPLECWRLMSFFDEDFYKAEKVCSNSQLYHQGGNSICRNVLIAIFGQMMPGKKNIYKEL